MAKKLTYEYVKNFIEQNDYCLLSNSYKNSRSFLTVKCPNNHTYNVRFNDFKQGSRCPHCKKLTLSALNRHPYEHVKNFIEQNGYSLLSTSYKNSNSLLTVQCPNNHTYKVRFNDFKQKSRCPICYGNKKLDYDHVKNFIEQNGHSLLSHSYKNSRSFLKIKCPNNHTYNIRYYSFQQGTRCPVCAKNNLRHDFSFIKNFIENENYTLLSDSYKNNYTKLEVKCPNDHTYKVTFNNFSAGCRCPFCSNNISKGEQDLALYIESLGISIIRNDRSLIVNPLTNNNLELDIYIPLLNKAIEYNGVYWHSLLNKQKLDKIKKNQCKKLGIDLLVIIDEKWINNNVIERERIKYWINNIK